jgi:hypothetical protein
MCTVSHKKKVHELHGDFSKPLLVILVYTLPLTLNHTSSKTNTISVSRNSLATVFLNHLHAIWD